MVENHLIVKFITRKFVPFIQLYALYVIMHGESGPGGGFQGGVIFGASFILYGLAFGLERGRRILPQKVNDILNVTGVSLYAGIGLLTMLIGGNYLEYAVLPLGTPQGASNLGILGIEIGVGITVAAIMTTIFFEMAGRTP